MSTSVVGEERRGEYGGGEGEYVGGEVECMWGSV